MATAPPAAEAPGPEGVFGEDAETAGRVAIEHFAGLGGGAVGRVDGPSAVGGAHLAAERITSKASRSTTAVPSRSSMTVVIGGATLSVMAQRKKP